jgi:hypothetical protein
MTLKLLKNNHIMIKAHVIPITLIIQDDLRVMESELT